MAVVCHLHHCERGSTSSHVTDRGCFHLRPGDLRQRCQPRPRRRSRLSPWRVVLLADLLLLPLAPLHHLRRRHSRAVVEGFSEGHPHGHPLVSQPRAELAVPAPLCGATREVAMHRHVDLKGSCESSPEKLCNLSEPWWWWWWCGQCVTCGCLSMRPHNASFLWTSANAPTASAGLASRKKNLRLFHPKAGSRRPKCTPHPNPRRGKILRGTPTSPPLLRRKGSTIFSISSALDALDPDYDEQVLRDVTSWLARLSYPSYCHHPGDEQE